MTQAYRARGGGRCLLVALVFLAGCAGDLSTREKGTLGGAAIGAGTGAIIGSAAGHTGVGALVGAGLGAMTGAIVGDSLQAREQSKATQSSPAAGQVTVPAQQAGVAPQLPAPAQQASVPPTIPGDPTRGQLTNGTSWRLDVYLDVDPSQIDSATPISLKSQEHIQANLDIGPHRIIARAYVETQFGTRLAGRFDRTVQVDPRSSGWNLRFNQTDFR